VGLIYVDSIKTYCEKVNWLKVV